MNSYLFSIFILHDELAIGEPSSLLPGSFINLNFDWSVFQVQPRGVFIQAKSLNTPYLSTRCVSWGKCSSTPMGESCFPSKWGSAKVQSQNVWSSCLSKSLSSLLGVNILRFTECWWWDITHICLLNMKLHSEEDDTLMSVVKRCCSPQITLQHKVTQLNSLMFEYCILSIVAAAGVKHVV